MIEEDIQIKTADGTADSVLFYPDRNGHYPGIIRLTDIGGIRESQREMARRLAAEKYCVLMPNVFYRNAHPPVFDFPVRPGDERTGKRIAELTGPLTPEAVQRDASSYIDFLASHSAMSEGPMGVVGYCFSGAMAMRIAAAQPGKIAAVASFHGGGLFTEKPDSPHLLLPLIKARLYFGHATADRSMPEDAIRGLEQALENWGGAYESEIYEGAAHGWTVPNGPVYNEPQAERAFHKMTGLFAAALA
jgi:carboxymethylenebutenolidase